MTIENYLSKPISERKEIVKNTDWRTSSFWLGSLQIAVQKHSPIGLGFLDKRLVDEYWALINKN